jgi:hypothetical protein
MNGDVPKRRAGRPQKPADQLARCMILSVNVREDLGLAIRADAERRGVSYSQLIRTYVVNGMAAQVEQEHAA